MGKKENNIASTKTVDEQRKWDKEQIDKWLKNNELKHKIKPLEKMPHIMPSVSLGLEV